jgi:bleomycin hydrolase
VIQTKISRLANVGPYPVYCREAITGNLMEDFMTTRQSFYLPVLILLTILVATSVLAADPVYRDPNKYPTLDEITAARDANQAVRDSLRAEVDAQYAAAAKAKDEAELSLRVDWTNIKRPSGPDAFDQLWHLPPTPQFYTGTCWAFCSTSFIESEAYRLSGNEIKLSEMWIVYWELVEKSESYLRTFGHTPVSQGGQDSGTLAVLAKYGAVPKSAYKGVLLAKDRHDHTPMMKELNGYLSLVLENGSWDLEQNMANVQAILNKHMGTPPESFQYDGKTYSPKAFLKNVMQVKPADYVSCVSRMDEPYYANVLLDVVDNWRRNEDYLNLPLHDFMEVIKKAVKDGYTVSIGGDNSEMGMDGMFDCAIVPEYDIPAKYINQASREFRINNRTTGDDHGVHVVGMEKIGGRTWFLIKDSNRSSRLGEFKGYYFWDADYVKLKMLSFTVHKDRLKGLLN